MRRLEIHVPEYVYDRLVELRQQGQGRSLSEVARRLLQDAVSGDDCAGSAEQKLSHQEITWRSYGVLLKLESLYEQAVVERGTAGERALAKARSVARRALLATKEGEQ